MIELKGDKLEESFLEFSHLEEADDDDDAYVLRVFAEVHEDDLLREYEYLFVRDAFQEIPQIQAIVDVLRKSLPLDETGTIDRFSISVQRRIVTLQVSILVS